MLWPLLSGVLPWTDTLCTCKHKCARMPVVACMAGTRRSSNGVRCCRMATCITLHNTLHNTLHRVFALHSTLRSTLHSTFRNTLDSTLSLRSNTLAYFDACVRCRSLATMSKWVLGTATRACHQSSPRPRAWRYVALWAQSLQGHAFVCAGFEK